MDGFLHFGRNSLGRPESAAYCNPAQAPRQWIALGRCEVAMTTIPGQRNMRQQCSHKEIGRQGPLQRLARLPSSTPCQHKQAPPPALVQWLQREAVHTEDAVNILEPFLEVEQK